MGKLKSLIMYKFKRHMYQCLYECTDIHTYIHTDILRTHAVKKNPKRQKGNVNF